MSVYSQVPTELWYKIFEYVGYSMMNRKRCIFITKKGTVCKKNRIKTDNGDEIWCKAHGKVLLKRFNQDNNAIKIIKELLGEKRCDYCVPIKYDIPYAPYPYNSTTLFRLRRGY